MNQNSSLRGSRAAWVAAVVFGASLAGCGGGGSSNSSGASSSFAVLTTSIQDNAIWAINRPMEFRFTQPVDLSSVNLNTISVLQIGGGPASGSFFLRHYDHDNNPATPDIIDPYTVVFQPTCPTQADFSDAGLSPGGVNYRLNIVGSSTGGPVVRATDGTGLNQSLTLNFTTPNTTNLSDLFVDTRTSAPAALVLATEPAKGQTVDQVASYLEVGGDSSNRTYFFKRPDTDPLALTLGAQVTESFTAPLNLYSASDSALAIVVEIDQPVSPAVDNISDSAVRMEYQNNAGTWVTVPHTVELVANCSEGGATLRIQPVGILPQARLVRIVLGASFRDIVGNGNLVDTVVGSFMISSSGGTPLSDEFKEDFNVGGTSSGSNQDTTALLDAPDAVWGDGYLKAGFQFGGTGGPHGDFDWTIGLETGPVVTTILNTVSTQITNDAQTATETVVNGQVDVRNLTVATMGVLDIRGPNPCVIRASGMVTIKGLMKISGSNNLGISSFNTTNLPASGSTGNGGGGRGGTGNILTTQSCPGGEAGAGFMDIANGGGGGGETGYNSSGDVNMRRGGGGGGGSFGLPMVLVNAANTNQCPDQTLIGLDSEDGSPGALAASGAISGQGQRPHGGTKGVRPFTDLIPGTTNPNNANDFWGLMRVGTTVIVRGELSTPWGGEGGGGGGNCCQTASFPTTPWSPSSDERGAGGGGGGGSLLILALDNIVFGPKGRIEARGGTGGGGENSNGTNRVGGGSGGGSGGHVILQTAKKIDFRQCLVAQNAGINARGGQGGAGKDGAGGTMPNAIETGPFQDRLPADEYSVALGGVVDPAPCAISAVGNTANNHIDGCGGDGGPGLIQLHPGALTDILLPLDSATTLYKILKPNPVGSTVTATVNNVATPTLWNQLLPIFGRFSKAQSDWIPLGATSVAPMGDAPQSIAFQFGGLNGTGFVATSGSGSTATVTDLPSIMTGTGMLATEPTLPYVASDNRSVVFDATTVIDPVYLSNLNLLRSFELRIDQGAVHNVFEIGTASYSAGLLRVTLTDTGVPLLNLHTGNATVRPRFFRVRTDGTFDSLPTSATVKIEFQCAPASVTGDADALNATPFTSDVNVLNTYNSGGVTNHDFRFFRFRVGFDIDALGTGNLTAATPIPSLDFLRVPFRF